MYGSYNYTSEIEREHKNVLIEKVLLYIVTKEEQNSHANIILRHDENLYLVAAVEVMHRIRKKNGSPC